MKKLDNNGFSLIEVVLILVVIVMVGALGWYSYSKKQDNKNADGGPSNNWQPFN